MMDGQLLVREDYEYALQLAVQRYGDGDLGGCEQLAKGLIALDPGRDPSSPVTRVAKMARVEGARVIEIRGDPTLGPIAAQLPLAVATAP